jgi:hypothetical protein
VKERKKMSTGRTKRLFFLFVVFSFLCCTFVASATAQCTYTLVPPDQIYVSAGGTGNVTVGTQAGCPWTPFTNDEWINFTAGSGPGPGTVSYTIDENTDRARAGQIQVQTEVFEVIQEGTLSVARQNTDNNHAYERFERVFIWDNARAYCEALGGYPATITDLNEQNFIYINFMTGGSSYLHECWLGGFQSPTATSPDTDWQWVTGETWSYTNWCNISPYCSSPDDFGVTIFEDGEENHLSIWHDFMDPGTEGTWDDLDGSKIRTFICEWPETTAIYRIMAFIGGRSRLSISDYTAQWHHYSLEAPGRFGYSDEPTIINGMNWLPAWLDVPDELNFDCNCDSEDVFINVSPPLPLTQQTYVIQPISARDSVSIVEQPSTANGYTLTIEFDDTTASGAEWYIIDIAQSIPAPAISVSPATSYYFGNVGVGTTATRQFTITNTGDADLTVSSIGCENLLAPPFSLLGSTCIGPNIPPLGTCTYTVQFDPSATGYVTDTFDICSNAPDAPLLTVSGTGVLYTLNVFRTGNGSGTVTSTDSLINCGTDCQETYTLNTQVTLSAAPNTDSTFTGWSGACTGTGQCMVTMSASQSVTAQFTLNTYPVTASAGPGGSISPSSVSVNHGSSTQFTVTPDPGYQIASVSGCGGSLNQNTYTTGMVTAACTVTASFEVRNYTVTPSAGAHGSISPSGPQSVQYNGTVSFTVIPEEGYHIESVSGCGGALAASAAETKKKRKNKRKNKIALLSSTYTTGPVTEDCTMTAVFAVNTYTVTAAAGEGGSVSPSSQAVSHGSSAHVTIAPGEGYHIESVSGCGGSLSDSSYTTGAITADCTVTAEFAVNTYTVTPSAGEHGSISPSEAQAVNHNEAVSFIESVSGCGGSLSGTVMENAKKKKKKKARRATSLAVDDAQTYTTGPVTADCTVTAEFAVNTYTVTPSAGEHGSISPSEAQAVNHNEAVSFAEEA